MRKLRARRRLPRPLQSDEHHHVPFPFLRRPRPARLRPARLRPARVPAPVQQRRQLLEHRPLQHLFRVHPARHVIQIHLSHDVLLHSHHERHRDVAREQRVRDVLQARVE